MEANIFFRVGEGGYNRGALWSLVLDDVVKKRVSQGLPNPTQISFLEFKSNANNSLLKLLMH